MPDVIKEWFIEAPWGKIALVSWGDESCPPVLLCHGWYDSLATFEPLLDLLPKSYHYVGLDLPGHGHSDPLPHGIIANPLYLIPSIRLVVKHLGWKKFIYIGHSMGSTIGFFYNAIYPGEVIRFVHLDVSPGILYMQIQRLSIWYRLFYEQYYENYNKIKPASQKLVTMDAAIESVMRSRDMDERQAQIILSRNLIFVGDGKYRYTWDPNLRKFATINITNEQLYYIMSSNAPPTLELVSSESAPEIQAIPGVRHGYKLMQDLRNNVPNYFAIPVQGGHNVHVTNPERVASHMMEFLKRDFNDLAAKSKL